MRPMEPAIFVGIELQENRQKRGRKNPISKDMEITQGSAMPVSKNTDLPFFGSRFQSTGTITEIGMGIGGRVKLSLMKTGG